MFYVPLMTLHRVLVVEDEPDMLTLIQLTLERAGFAVETEMSGDAALERIREGLPDVLVLDALLPGIDGYELCRILHNDPRTVSVPVLMLTARGEVQDRLRGLEAGAKDYVIKPFNQRELAQRVKMLAQRTGSAAQACWNVGPFEIDAGKKRVLLSGKDLSLSEEEMRVLVSLLDYPDCLQTREDLLRQIRIYDETATNKTVDIHIDALRCKLGEFAAQIQSVRDHGYKYVRNGKGF